MKRNAKKMVTTVLAGVMVMSMGMNAFAKVPGDGLTITKTVTTDGNTYAPNTTFNFEVTPGTGKGADENSLAAPDQVVVYPGVDKGLNVVGAAQFAPNKEEPTSEVYTDDTVRITVDSSAFTKPGVYHYQVSEVIPQNEDKYEGIKYDESVKDLLVYVVRNEEDGTFTVDGVIEVKDGQKVGEGTGVSFTNNYGKQDPDQPDPEDDTTHDITVTKKVTGNQGDQSKVFNFAISVTPASEGEIYKLVKISNGTETFVQAIGATDMDVTVGLKSGESVKIYGLSENDSYSITETDANQDGYTTTATGDNVNDGQTGSAGRLDADNKAATVTNARNISTPTGIILTFAPYILMVAAAGVLAVMFLRKKREEI